ncbi:unnamed protein product [Caenorhabditis bovis]|uniref:Uncharacterized protein n=1 Tax=Caenorhabditis bovis TaxID=2654633 RepID=A0A8S1EBJ7_9PELO|nr:unnamed protein product [Caenorhabditis bovis]
MPPNPTAQRPSSSFDMMFSDKAQPVDLLGPYRYIIKLTGLDCSAVTSSKKCASRLITAFAILVILSQFFRTIVLFSSEGPVLSFAWAESNMFAFMGIHGITCAFCLFGWTKNKFLSNLVDGLRQLAQLRPIPLFFCVFGYSINAAFEEKFLLGGHVVKPYLYVLMPILTFYTILIVSCTLTIYVVGNVALTRELEYMNCEIEKQSKDNNLKVLIDFVLIPIFIHSGYCCAICFQFKTNEILELVQTSNNSLGSYGKFGPIFGFFGIINAIYISSFSGTIPSLPYTCLIITMFSDIAIVLFTLIPPSKLQEEIEKTAKIIMLDSDIESTKEPQLYHTYRIMCDRSLRFDTALYVLNGFPINSRSFNVAMFIIPNIGAVLILLKKCLEYNGIKVQ